MVLQPGFVANLWPGGGGGWETADEQWRAALQRQARLIMWPGVPTPSVQNRGLASSCRLAVQLA
jgi:hypothetical protein